MIINILLSKTTWSQFRLALFINKEHIYPLFTNLEDLISIFLKQINPKINIC